MFQKDGQDVESLIDLTVSVYQVWIVHGQNVIDANIDIDSCRAVLVLEQRYFNCGNIAQGAFLCNLLNNLAAVFDKLVLVVGHSTMEHNDDIDVTATRRPQSIHAGSCGWDRDFSLKQVRLRPAVPIVERVLDTFDDLVSSLQVRALDALLFVDYANDLLSSL